MSEEQQEMSGTKPVAEHAWLQNLVGEWTVETEMSMGPDSPSMTGTGTEKVTSFGGLWAFGEGSASMPNGELMEYRSTWGWDVSFKEYRGCWFANVSSHLWKYSGKLSEDQKTLTLDCDGPSFDVDGETAPYRDVIQLIDENHRTLTSYGKDEAGNWQQFMKSTYTRVG